MENKNLVSVVIGGTSVTIDTNSKNFDSLFNLSDEISIKSAKASAILCLKAIKLSLSVPEEASEEEKDNVSRSISSMIVEALKATVSVEEAITLAFLYGDHINTISNGVGQLRSFGQEVDFDKSISEIEASTGNDFSLVLVEDHEESSKGQDTSAEDDDPMVDDEEDQLDAQKVEAPDFEDRSDFSDLDSE